MIKRIVLTDDHIKLLRLIRFEEGSSGLLNNKVYIDKVNPYMLPGMLEDIAMVLGYKDKAIPGTEEDAEGAAFPDDVEKYLLSVHHYIVDNFVDIENLIHQFAFNGGLTPGTYKSLDTENIWEKEVI